METLIRNCKQCGTPIDLRKGRKDRMFCDENCKNKYHNTQTFLEAQEIKRIQLVLKKNRRVLKKLFDRVDRDEIKKERLLKEGFELGLPHAFCDEQDQEKSVHILFRLWIPHGDSREI